MRWVVGGLALVLTSLPMAQATDSSPPPLPATPSPPKVLADQWQRSLRLSDALRLPKHITRDDVIEQVALKDTIALALENNPGIAARRLEPTRFLADVLGTEAQYDPALSGEAIWGREDTPNASALAGDLGTTINRNRDVNFRLGKLLRTSTQVNVDFLTDRLDTNLGFQNLSPQYSPELNFSVVQPLLRGFGWDFTYLVVQIAEHTADAAVFEYEADLADFVQLVINAYWTVVGTRENVVLRRESLELAERTVQENEARVRVGLLAPVSVLEAQADAKARETDLIVAENQLKTARQRLAQLAFYRPADTFLPRMLEPADDVPIEDIDIDEMKALEGALVARPEILASALRVESNQYEERRAANGLLPRFDLVGGYGLNGLSGDSKDVTFGATGASPFAGPERDAYERLFDGDFQSYSVGLRFQIPFSNAEARSQEARARVSRDQAELLHRELLSNVTLEVRESSANVADSRKAIETSRVARELAAENLRNQEKRHEVGMATTKDLLDFQNRLTQARFSEVQARVQHANALTSWRMAHGRLLEHYQIVVRAPERSNPWFRRF
jgi:outer membrane protein TolC